MIRKKLFKAYSKTLGMSKPFRFGQVLSFNDGKNIKNLTDEIVLDVLDISDKNGQGFCEGDMFKFRGYDYIVVFLNGHFIGRCAEYSHLFCPLNSELEIFGNFYSMPDQAEFLKSCENAILSDHNSEIHRIETEISKHKKQAEWSEAQIKTLIENKNYGLVSIHSDKLEYAKAAIKGLEVELTHKPLLIPWILELLENKTCR